MTVPSHEVLRDVRRAYRLLHDYQRLVLDSLKFIGTHLGFRYIGGWNKFCGGAPRDGKGTLDHWAWDWLGLYYYEFHFERTLPSGTLLKLSALHMPDTAALSVENKVDTSTFPSAEMSRSRMAFIFLNGKDTWNFEPVTLDSDSRRLLADGGKLPEKCVVAGMMATVYDMDRLFTEESARGVVADLHSLFDIPEANSIAQ